MRRVYLLPNLITLANAFCGLLAMGKAIDALTWASEDSLLFYAKLETACGLVFLGMVFDALDGWVARITRAHSAFGAQLDSFSDAITFGVTPAVLAKVLFEHEALAGIHAGHARLNFLVAAAFALMAILRLVRFNLETDEEAHESGAHTHFRGLPSPAGAGAIVSTIWLYLILRNPALESTEGTPTPFSKVLGWMKGVDWNPWLDKVPALLLVMLPVIGLLMVSRVRYVHMVSFLTINRSTFFSLVWVVFGVFMLYLAPVPFLFLLFNGFALFGVLVPLLVRGSGRPAPPA
jgi:CDP-diacylglycerol--serine O-phosphatidyltransferase